MSIKTTSLIPRSQNGKKCSFISGALAKWKQWKGELKDHEAKLEREYLRIKDSVKRSNTALILDKVKVKLKLTSYKSIGLQGNFPCKPSDVGKDGSRNKKYTLSVAFTANDMGLKAAIMKARELDLY